MRKINIKIQLLLLISLFFVNNSFSQIKYITVNVDQSNVNGCINNLAISKAFKCEVFPNPSNGEFYIKFNVPVANRKINIEAFNIIGQKIAFDYLEVISEQTYKIKLNSTGSNLCYLIIKINEQLKIEKVVVFPK